MPGTLDDLGKMVQDKYPGAYDDMDPADVALKVQAKYPGAYDDFQGRAPKLVSEPGYGSPEAEQARLQRTGEMRPLPEGYKFPSKPLGQRLVSAFTEPEPGAVLPPAYQVITTPITAPFEVAGKALGGAVKPGSISERVGGAAKGAVGAIAEEARKTLGGIPQELLPESAKKFTAETTPATFETPTVASVLRESGAPGWVAIPVDMLSSGGVGVGLEKLASRVGGKIIGGLLHFPRQMLANKEAMQAVDAAITQRPTAMKTARLTGEPAARTAEETTEEAVRQKLLETQARQPSLGEEIPQAPEHPEVEAAIRQAEQDRIAQQLAQQRADAALAERARQAPLERMITSGEREYPKFQAREGARMLRGEGQPLALPGRTQVQLDLEAQQQAQAARALAERGPAEGKGAIPLESEATRQITPEEERAALEFKPQEPPIVMEGGKPSETLPEAQKRISAETEAEHEMQRMFTQPAALGERMAEPGSSVWNILERIHSDTKGEMDVGLLMDKAHELYRGGAEKLADFAARMKDWAGDLWEPISRHIPALYDAVKGALTTGKGAVGAMKTVLQAPLEGAARVMEMGGSQAFLRRNLGESIEPAFAKITEADQWGQSLTDRLVTPLENAQKQLGGFFNYRNEKWLRRGGAEDWLAGKAGAETPPSPEAQAYAEAYKAAHDEMGQVSSRSLLGTKLRGDHVLPKAYSEEVADALMSQKGDVFDAIKARNPNADFADISVKLRNERALGTARSGSLEFARLLDLPRDITLADGRVIQTYSPDIMEAGTNYLKQGAQRLAVARLAEGLGLDEASVPDIAKELLKGTGGGGKATDAMSAILNKMQGAPVSPNRLFTSAMSVPALRKLESLAQNISMPAILSRTGLKHYAGGMFPMVAEAQRLMGPIEGSKGAWDYIRNAIRIPGEGAKLAEGTRILEGPLNAADTDISAKLSKWYMENVTLTGPATNAAARTAGDITVRLFNRAAEVARTKPQVADSIAQAFHMTPEAAMRMKTGTATLGDMQGTMRDFVGRTTLRRPSPLEVIPWMEDPIASRLFPLQKYSQKVGNIAALAARSAKSGNPGALVALATLGVGFTGAEVGVDRLTRYASGLLGHPAKDKSLDEDIYHSLMHLPLGAPVAALAKGAHYLATGKSEFSPAPEVTVPFQAARNLATKGNLGPLESTLPVEAVRKVTGTEQPTSTRQLYPRGSYYRSPEEAGAARRRYR